MKKKQKKKIFKRVCSVWIYQNSKGKEQN